MAHPVLVELLMRTPEPLLPRVAATLLALATSAGTAAAQDAPLLTPDGEPTDVVPSEPPFLERFGIAFVVGGGIDGFTNMAMRANTGDGGSWNARVIAGMREWIGFEVAYFGSAQELDALGVDNDALLVGNGLQANLRFNLSVDQRVQPFIHAGTAVRHYSVKQVSLNTSDVRSSNDVLEMPVGVGLALRLASFLLDVRGEFRPATGDALMPMVSAANGNAPMHRWGINANLGYAW